jgi:hypothetical protein
MKISLRALNSLTFFFFITFALDLNRPFTFKLIKRIFNNIIFLFSVLKSNDNFLNNFNILYSFLIYSHIEYITYILDIYLAVISFKIFFTISCQICP